MKLSGWERLPAWTGGSVAGLATATDEDGASLVFAATSVGVYGSSDTGRSWSVASTGESVPFIEVVAPSPDFARDRTIFAGGRNGLYRSLDAGATWSMVLTAGRVLSVALASGDEGTSVLFAGTEQDGVLRSEDGGRTWASANPGLLDLTVLALGLSPDLARDGIGFAATASGLYRTRNGGKSWREVEIGMDDAAVQCLAVSPSFADDRLVLAGTESEGLLRSDDGGGTWEVVSALGGRGVTALAISSRDPTGRTIAAAIDGGIAISVDGGGSWRVTETELGPVLSLTFVSAGNGEVLLAGLHRDGAARSADGGGRWEPANEGLHARLLVGLMLSPAFETDQTLFAAGPDDGVVVSTDGGRTWEARSLGPEDPAVYSVAASPGFARDRMLYAAAATGIQRSRDVGATWQPVPVGAEPAPARLVITGPADGDEASMVLAADANGRLRASDDAGESWRALGDGFGGAEVVSLALSPAYAHDRTIFVGTSSSTTGEVALWRSVDGGVSWQRWLVERGGELLPLAVPSSYPRDEVVFVGLSGRVLKPRRHAREVRSGERRPLWRGVDLGAEPSSITALATPPGPGDEATLFAATSSGVYVSRDGGESFNPWSEGLTPPSVVALAVSPSYARDRLVYALGLGGTVWRRRDVDIG